MKAKLFYANVKRKGSYEVAEVNVLKVETGLNKADIEVVSGNNYFEKGTKLRVSKDRLKVELTNAS